jgi:hypothetical protein
VVVVDEFIYSALCRYYNALEKKGYMAISNAYKLLLLIFYRDFVYSDYRCTLSKNDYRLIERALDCLYGTTCLIPYPDYLKMGKLKLGSMTELACRIKAIEDTDVVKVIHDLKSVSNDFKSDIIIMAEDKENSNTSPSNNNTTPSSDVTPSGNNNSPSDDNKADDSKEQQGNSDSGTVTPGGLIIGGTTSETSDTLPPSGMSSGTTNTGGAPGSSLFIIK